MRTHNVNRKHEGDRVGTVWLHVSRVRTECWLGLEVWRDGPVDMVCACLSRLDRLTTAVCSLFLHPSAAAHPSLMLQSSSLKKNSPISYTHIFLRLAPMCGVAMSPHHRTAALCCATTSPFIIQPTGNRRSHSSHSLQEVVIYSR